MPTSVVLGGNTKFIFTVMTLEEITSQRGDRQGTSSGTIQCEKPGSNETEPSVRNLPEARVMNHMKYKSCRSLGTLTRTDAE